jgi:hypothetical protein
MSRRISSLRNTFNTFNRASPVFAEFRVPRPLRGKITLQECLRALLRLGGLKRRSELKLDEQNLYARSLRIAIDGGAR